jgi:type I restriction-modification system DNA methylase subunit
MNKQQLASTIWESANQMRSKIEANEYKDFILGFIFYKYLSERELELFRKEKLSDEEIRKVDESDVEYAKHVRETLGYFISYNNLFSTWLEKGSDFDIKDVRDALSDFDRNIDEVYNKVFAKIFNTLQTGMSKLGETSGAQTKSVKKLLRLIKKIPMDGKQDYDVLGFIYEYLISNFAANAGKKAGEFYTPHEVSVLMSEIVAEHLKDKKQIKIYDPAAGSGNFLTETYLSLRRLENRVVSDLTGGQMVLGDVLDPIKVSITQFHGIEINDFAVTVAKTALWIAESQMMKETEAIIVQHLDFLPLTTNANIVEANALRIDWNDVVDKSKLNYIMGNPPFVGTKMMDKAQKSDVEEVFSSWRNHGLLDYVACWYKRAADYIQNTTISCAFVSTNSITQGEQVAALWKPLIQTRGIHINYAYREFVWDSEAQIKAHVHVVIIGFGLSNSQDKILYDGDEIKHVQNINGYLTDAPDCFIERNTRPISSVPQMYLGCSFYDGNNLVLTPEEKDELLVKEPNAKRFIRPYMMGGDFIARKPRFCLWLLHANPKELSKCPEVLRRVQATKDFRKTCKKAMTQKAAETPTIPPILN